MLACLHSGQRRLADLSTATSPWAAAPLDPPVRLHHARQYHAVVQCSCNHRLFNSRPDRSQWGIQDDLRQPEHIQPYGRPSRIWCILRRSQVVSTHSVSFGGKKPHSGPVLLDYPGRNSKAHAVEFKRLVRKKKSVRRDCNVFFLIVIAVVGGGDGTSQMYFVH